MTGENLFLRTYRREGSKGRDFGSRPVVIDVDEFDNVVANIRRDYRGNRTSVLQEIYLIHGANIQLRDSGQGAGDIDIFAETAQILSGVSEELRLPYTDVEGGGPTPKRV